MKGVKARAKTNEQKSFLMPTLREQLDARQPVYRLAERIPWEFFEREFGEFYSEEGRPAKPVRLMVGLLLLKQMFNLGDEPVVAQWVQNPYWQFFCGEEQFQWSPPCDPSDLVHFRNRIGEAGATLIFSISVEMHGERAREKEVVIDSTVQEKNVTYPTDTKLYRKVITRCWKLADGHAIKLRRRYYKEVRKCVLAQRGRKHPRTRKAAHKAARRLRTIAGRLIRELERKLPKDKRAEQKENFTLYRRVLAQKPQDKDKIYSLHEPHIYCIAKGKEHKKYEFGTKASVVLTKTTGVIVATMSHERNVYDGHTLPEMLEQTEAVTAQRPDKAMVDRGYRGARHVGSTEILVPARPPAGQTKSQRNRMRERFRRRCAIEPVIGHLKSDCRMARNYLSGFAGDGMNLLLAATAWNLRKWMRMLLAFLSRFLTASFHPPTALTPVTDSF